MKQPLLLTPEKAEKFKETSQNLPIFQLSTKKGLNSSTFAALLHLKM